MVRPASSAPLVARTQQLAALREALSRAASGRAGTVLLAGDAGAGKSRLAEELLSIAADGGATVLVGHCIDLGGVGVPYLPFSEALSGLHVPAEGPSEVAELIAARPALGRLGGWGAPDLGQDEVGRLQLFDAVGGLLTDLGARHGPAVLLLEDLHWADQSTRDLFRFLVARARDQHVLLLGTYRSDDLHRRHPLRPLLAELLRHPTVERLEVPPFTEPEMRAFVAAVGPKTLPEPEVRQVIERAEGNAYFAEELLDCDADRSRVPERLTDVLLTRVERLDTEVHELVRLASVAGRRVAEPLLRAVSELPPDAVDSALREAVTHHVLVPAESGTYQFRHALLAEAVYTDLLPGERVRLHAAYAKALAGGDLGSAAELAHHSLASHDLPAALSASLAAADEAARRLAPAETLQHLEGALQLWPAVQDAETRSGGDQVQLLLRAAGAAGRCGELDRAVALAREAVSVAVASGDPPREAAARKNLAQALMANEQPGAWSQSARAVTVLMRGRATARGEDDDAVAAPDLPTGPPTSALVHAASMHARTCLNSDRDDESRRWAEWALPGARQLDLPGVEADLLTTLAVLEADEPEIAAQLLRQARARAVDAGDLGVELRSTYNLASNLFYAGDQMGALTELEAGRERAESTGTRWSIWAIEMRVLEVIARYLVGDWDGSESVASLVGDTPPDAVAARLSAAALYAQVGRGVEGALAAIERLRPAWVRDGQIALVAGGTQIDALTWEGRYAEAVAVADEVIAFMARTWNDYFLGGIWLSALATSALASQAAEATRGRGNGSGDPAAGLRREADRLLAHAVTTAERGRPRFGKLGPEGRAWLARAHAEHARAQGRADVPAWRAAVEEFGDGYPYEQARSRWRLAEALLEQGDRDAAATEARTALQTARRLRARPLEDAVRTLASRARLDLGDGVGVGGVPGNGVRGETAGRPDGASTLTPRESAVLALVAEGLTNRQVGERLFISDKTVSVHLSNVMAKLGASGRTEAVSLAYRRGLLERR